MSDILVIMSSEAWGELNEILREQKLKLSDAKVWGDGRGPSLKIFLNNLVETTYDENVHILTGVQEVRYTSRCPYPNTLPNHKECGWIGCAVCGKGEWAHPNIFGEKPHEYITPRL